MNKQPTTPHLAVHPNPHVFMCACAHSLETFYFINKQIRQQASITNSAKNLSYNDDGHGKAAAADSNLMFMKLFEEAKVCISVHVGK